MRFYSYICGQNKIKVQKKAFYTSKIALFLAFYLLTLTCVMQGDKFFKKIPCLHDFSNAISSQSMEDALDDGTHRFPNKISLIKLLNKYRPTNTSFFVSTIFISNSFIFNPKVNLTFFGSFLGKIVFSLSSIRLHLKYCVLMC